MSELPPISAAGLLFPELYKEGLQRAIHSLEPFDLVVAKCTRDQNIFPTETV